MGQGGAAVTPYRRALDAYREAYVAMTERERVLDDPEFWRTATPAERTERLRALRDVVLPEDARRRHMKAARALAAAFREATKA